MNPSRGRPREFDRERVLDGAMDAFWRNGAGATTTRDLERELGINPSSLYNAFGSKDGLIAEVLGRYRERMDAHVLAPLADATGGLEAIDDFFARLAHWLTRDGCRGCLVSRLVAEGGDHGETVTRMIRDHGRGLRAGLRSALAGAAASGEIPAATRERRLEVLTGMVFGLSLAAQGSSGAAGVRRIADADRREIASWSGRE